MASGSFYLENDTNLRCKVEWSTSGSRLTATLYAKKINATQATTGTWSYWISINGVQTDGPAWLAIGTDYVQIASYTRSVSGSTADIYAKVSAPSGTALAGQSCEGFETVTISTPEPEPEPDPDPSTISAATNCKFGDASMVSWASHSSSYYFNVKFTCGSYSKEYTVRPATTGLVQQSLVVVYDLINGVGSKDTSGTVTVTLTTLTSSGGTVGTSAKTITCTVPDNSNTKPSMTAATFTPSPDLIGGGYVQGKTGSNLTAATATGKYGATISSYFFRVEGKNFNKGTISDVIAQFGTIPLTAYAVDSRGFTSEGFVVNVSVIAYSKPKLKPVQGQHRVTASRCDAEGIADVDGTHLIIRAKREYSPVVYGGVQKNFCAIEYRYKPDTSTSWSVFVEILGGSAQSDEVTTLPLIGTLAPTGTYQVDIRAIDTLGGIADTILTVSSEIIFDHANGVLGSYGFGKYVEIPDVFDIAESKTLILRGAIELKGAAYNLFMDWMHPVGCVFETVNNENPGNILGGTWVLLETTESATKWRRTE